MASKPDFKIIPLVVIEKILVNKHTDLLGEKILSDGMKLKIYVAFYPRYMVLIIADKIVFTFKGGAEGIRFFQQLNKLSPEHKKIAVSLGRPAKLSKYTPELLLSELSK